MAEYIEREAVEKFIEDGLNNQDVAKRFRHDAIEIMAEVHYMPAADVAPVVHGRWLKRRNGGTLCNRCGHYTQYKGQVLDMSEAIACPWCGAMMDGGAE